MICFRDKTWCGSDCTNRACHRFFGPAQAAAARDWWPHDPENAPVSFADYSGNCGDYQPPKMEGAA